MVLILVECSDALAVNDQTFERFLGALIRKLNGFVPYPEALSARINGWTDTKAWVLLLFKQDSVKKEWLSGTVFASDSDHTDVFIS